MTERAPGDPLGHSAGRRDERGGIVSERAGLPRSASWARFRLVANRSDSTAIRSRARCCISRSSSSRSTEEASVDDEAVASGELQAHVDTAMLADALVGPILVCRLFHRTPVAVDDVPALVDQILPAADTR